jgi:hypothetical protein
MKIADCYTFPLSGGFVTNDDMGMSTRSLSTQESKVVLALTERGRREATRAEIVNLLGGSVKAADHVIESLRRKAWLERATWGEYLHYTAGAGTGRSGRQ